VPLSIVPSPKPANWLKVWLAAGPLANANPTAKMAMQYFHCAFTGLDDPQLDPRLNSLTIRHHQRIVCRDSATTTEIELSFLRMRTGPFEINYHE